MVLDYTQIVGQGEITAQRVADVSRQEAQRVQEQQVISEQRTQQAVSQDKVSWFDYKIDKLNSKIDKVEDRIDAYKEKLASGESTAQDRIQYSRYVQLREDLKNELSDVKESRSNALRGYSAQISTPSTSFYS